MRESKATWRGWLFGKVRKPYEIPGLLPSSLTTFQSTGDSDLLTEFNAYCAWRRVCIQKTVPEFQFCRKNLLNSQTLSNIEDLKSQLTTAAADAGFVALSHSDRSDLSR